MAQDYDAGGMLRRPSGVRTDVGTLLGRTMRLVALTVGVALDAYLARNLSGGWAMAFWIASFSNVDPEAVWEAGGATALFVPAAAPAAMRRDETSPHPARVLLWALIVLIAFGVLLIFASTPAGSVVYALLELVIFAGLVMYDFQRRRVTSGMDTAPLYDRATDDAPKLSTARNHPRRRR